MPATTVTTTGQAQSCADPPRSARDKQQRAFLTLNTALTSPRRARAWTSEVLAEWQLADLADDAEFVVGELVANAAVHASAELGALVIGVELAFRDGELSIWVSDGDPALPQARRPTADDLSGRGLLMVEALSDRHGWHPLEGAAGKVVWAALKARQAPSATSPPYKTLDAPARPEADQPGGWRDSLTAPGRSGRTATTVAVPAGDENDGVPALTRLLASSAAGATSGAR